MRVLNWRASVASETLTGVTQLKIGDVCLFSERAKRAKLTISRVQLRFQIYIYICRYTNKLVVRSNSANAWRASKYMSIGKDDL